MTGQDHMQRIRDIAEQICNRAGCYLYDLEMVGAGGTRALRVYVDREDAKGGASIEDCTTVSRGMNEFLDANEDLIPGEEYELEVSTPGLERSLKVARHFEKAMGKTISVYCAKPILDSNSELLELGKMKHLVGPLLGHDDQGIKVGYVSVEKKPKESKRQQAIREAAALASGEAPASSDNGFIPVFIPFSSITKAHTVFDFDEAIRAAKHSAKDQKKSDRAEKAAKKQ